MGGHGDRLIMGTEKCKACFCTIVETSNKGLPCGHFYCTPCITSMFTGAIIGERDFPPRCCQPLSLSDVFGIFDSATVAWFSARFAEYETPVNNRMYCYNCYAFIPAACVLRTLAHCFTCRHETYKSCKQRSHPGACNEKARDAETIALAATQGWQRCRRCGYEAERYGRGDYMRYASIYP